MSEPIKVGDLVMVVRGNPCCGQSYSLGKIFCVAEIDTVYGSTCTFCGAPVEYALPAAFRNVGDMTGSQLRKLKRIDPPADAVSEDARKTIKEPA